MKLVWFVWSALISRRGPLSALRATLPEGESCFRRLRDTFPKGEGGDLFRRLRDTFPEGEGGDLFCRVGTLLAFGFKCRSEKFFDFNNKNRDLQRRSKSRLSLWG